METPVAMWLMFWVIVIVCLFIDLIVSNKNQGSINTKKASIIVSVWTAIAIIFGSIIYIWLGQSKALEFFTGYIVEYSLSIDNMFVFLMIFSFFNIPKQNQLKVLIYGIIEAVILRFLFVFVGIGLINAFSWIIYLFGIILIYTSVKMMMQKNKKIVPENNIAYKILRKIIPLDNNNKTKSFFVKKDKVLYATPMFAAVVVIEMSDIIFAVDSIPAVLSISVDPYIVYTSNIFAIIGLRALYFLLSNLAEKFKFLKFAIAIILLFVGFKMILSHFIDIPTLLSLLVIITILLSSIIASKYSNTKFDF
ncbi:MAG: TerC/Alx family metal homeostasis membrane protein [Endomicrobium sp.]|jgi:tellurite resistance protein TerC|uniref:TerC/Alx family metal homeostasis membrane protein n=1 Tax=Candidatus Endomicrobiellum cubanum TaxID=3242325 RepID=UPI002838D0FF|nr:TerC/Alx family metal homeostasis membrane protein [Endomicrobium sp.]